jgi:hypothetical protein
MGGFYSPDTEGAASGGYNPIHARPIEFLHSHGPRKERSRRSGASRGLCGLRADSKSLVSAPSIFTPDIAHLRNILPMAGEASVRWARSFRTLQVLLLRQFLPGASHSAGCRSHPQWTAFAVRGHA